MFKSFLNHLGSLIEIGVWLMKSRQFVRAFSRLMIVSYRVIKADTSCHFHLILSSHMHLWGVVRNLAEVRAYQASVKLGTEQQAS